MRKITCKLPRLRNNCRFHIKIRIYRSFPCLVFQIALGVWSVEARDQWCQWKCFPILAMTKNAHKKTGFWRVKRQNKGKKKTRFGPPKTGLKKKKPFWGSKMGFFWGKKKVILRLFWGLCYWTGPKTSLGFGVFGLQIARFNSSLGSPLGKKYWASGPVFRRFLSKTCVFCCLFFRVLVIWGRFSTFLTKKMRVFCLFFANIGHLGPHFWSSLGSPFWHK